MNLHDVYIDKQEYKDNSGHNAEVSLRKRPICSALMHANP